MTSSTTTMRRRTKTAKSERKHLNAGGADMAARGRANGDSELGELTFNTTDPRSERAPASSAELAARVRAMYIRRGGVVLSLDQVATLLGVSRATSAEVMTRLVRERLLRCSARGEYMLR
jgi:hypothetical protein